ncbi:MAG: hypothetical protein ABR541_00965 [Candidatus Dormibacteria bacterium]
MSQAPPEPEAPVEAAELRRLTEDTDRQLDRWRDGDADIAEATAAAGRATTAAPPAVG